MDDQNNISLADLSHATLVEHATQLQEDYNRVSTETVTKRDISLADLSHATLVEHATQLQEDYNRVSTETVTKLKEANQEKARLDIQVQSLIEENKGLKVQNQNLLEECDESDEQIEELQGKVQEQTNLKNKHIDLHVESSRHANELEQELAMVRRTLEEVTGHLLEASKEAERLDGLNQKLNIELEESKQAELKMGRKISGFIKQIENHPATMKTKAKTSRLRYETAQTLIRWGALFASISAIGYHLA